MRADLQLAIDSRDTTLFGVGALPKRGVPVRPETIAEALELAGAQRQIAEALRREAMQSLDAWMGVALEMGMPLAQVAKLAGVTRATVYARQRGAGGQHYTG